MRFLKTSRAFELRGLDVVNSCLGHELVLRLLLSKLFTKLHASKIGDPNLDPNALHSLSWRPLRALDSYMRLHSYNRLKSFLEGS